MLNKDTPTLLWYSLFNRLTEIKEYDDFNSEFNILLSYYQTSKEDINEKFEDLLKRYWKRIFYDVINEVLRKIKRKKTKGELFKSEEIKLKKLLTRSEKNMELPEYENLYIELEELKQIIVDKLDKEKFDTKKYREALLIGFVLGIIASIIGAVLIKIFM